MQKEICGKTLQMKLSRSSAVRGSTQQIWDKDKKSIKHGGKTKLKMKKWVWLPTVGLGAIE